MPFRIFLLTILLSCASWSDVLHVAVPKEGYPPYIIVQDNRVSGAMVEVLEKACAQLGLVIQYQYYPEVRSKLLLDQGVIHARMEAPAWSDNPSRYYWSDGIVDIEDVFVYRSRNVPSFSSLAEVDDAVLITHLGYHYPTLDPLFRNERAKRQDYPSEVAMLNGLMNANSSSAVAAIMDRNVTQWLIRHNRNYLGQFAYSQFLVDKTPLHFQFAKTDLTDKWIEKINQEIRRLLASGAHKEAMEKSMAQ